MAISYYGTDGTSGDSTWRYWITASSDSTTSSATDYIWSSWTSDTYTTTTSASTSGGTWHTWVVDSSYVTTKKKESARELKKRLRAEAKQQAIRKAEEEKRQAEEKAKEAKARQLLREVLTDEQDKQLEEKGYFELVSVSSGQRYRINKGRSRNINKIDQEGKVIGTVCFHPKDNVHHYDTMAIQKLMLENDEAEARKVANFG